MRSNDHDSVLEERAEQARAFAMSAIAALDQSNGGGNSSSPSIDAAAAALELAMLLLAANTCRAGLRGRLADPALRDALHAYDRLASLFRAVVRAASQP